MMRNDCLFEHPAVDLSEAFDASAWNAWNEWNEWNIENFNMTRKDNKSDSAVRDISWSPVAASLSFCLVRRNTTWKGYIVYMSCYVTPQSLTWSNIGLWSLETLNHSSPTRSQMYWKILRYFPSFPRYLKLRSPLLAGYPLPTDQCLNLVLWVQWALLLKKFAKTKTRTPILPRCHEPRTCALVFTCFASASSLNTVSTLHL